jgi:FkbM family methyltransferase
MYRYKIFEKLKRSVLTEFPKLSYSRSGEDLLLDEIFEFKATGFYVDIGAFHPVKYSNTFKFYLKGWRGINIEPNKDLIKKFETVRGEDTNLNIGISNTPGIKQYYKNNADPSMNTLSIAFAENAEQEFGFSISEVLDVEVKTLSDVLAAFALDKRIDFFSVDVEGYDLEVLKSNDWNHYRPRIVLVELNCSINDIASSDIYSFLTDNHYLLLSYTFLNYNVGNAFFVDCKHDES